MRLIPEKVREMRERRLLTQAELAERAGMTESTVNRIEQGLQQPRITTVRKIADALGVNGEELVVWVALSEEGVGSNARRG
jgi:transcriptional regulator with XRE-family HTH domain